MIEGPTAATDAGVPTISVIMPAFNDAAYLPAALRSLQEQSFRNFECIIVDDGSTDNTFAVANQFCHEDDRFRYIRREHDGSPGTARNLAVRHASGHILVFQDSDDISLPDRLARISESFASDPTVGVVYHDYFVFDHNNPSHEYRYFKGRYETPNGLIYKNLYVEGGLHSSLSASVLARWYRHFAGQKARTEIAIGEDFEFFLRLSPAVSCSYIDAPLLRARRRKPQHLSGDVVHSIESRLGAMEAFERQYPELKPQLSDIRKKTLGTLWFSLGRAYLWRGDDLPAQDAFRTAFGCYPTVNLVVFLALMSVRGGALLRWTRKLKSRFFPPRPKLITV